jgi:L-ascorbate metabolism protein UlaG (beta-lactamase superfamily)
MSVVKVIYHGGHSMFGINSSLGTKIITDPYNEKIKSVLPDVSANIVLSSHDHFDHNNISIVRDDPVLINKQGKTEIS